MIIVYINKLDILILYQNNNLMNENNFYNFEHLNYNSSICSMSGLSRKHLKWR